MAGQDLTEYKIGWIGTGRMGFAMAYRLLKGGADVSVWNRTKSKAEPLAEFGATVVDSPADLAGCDIVFTMVGGPADFVEVTLGDAGVLSQSEKPRMLIDSTSVDEEASAKVRAAASEMGIPMLAAPVSGNAKVVKAGKLTFAVSGPEDAYNTARPYLDFLNNSVMGSMFSRYKTGSLVNLDYSVTFTPKLLLKDLDLGLAAARANGVPMPVTAAAREIVQSLIGNGYTDEDFAALLSLQAAASGLELKSENKQVPDGLSD